MIREIVTASQHAIKIGAVTSVLADPDSTSTGSGVARFAAPNVLVATATAAADTAV